jgi:hypothetical protein
MSYFVEAQFSGVVDREALQIASNQAVAHHPLLRAIVERHWGRWQWILPEMHPPTIDWQNWWQSHSLIPREVKIDLRREGGLRLIAQAGPERSRLILVGHHAASDGIGTLNFLGDLLATYHRLISGSDDGLGELDWDVAGLAHRGRIAWGRRARPAPADQPPGAPLRRNVILSEALQFLTLSPLRLAPRSAKCEAAADGPGTGPPYTTAFVDAPQVHSLRELAHSSGAHLNDLLVREMVLTILDWQAEQSGTLPHRGAIRITMPVNLRSQEQRRLPAANVLSYGFVHARPAEWTDPPALLGGIAGQTRAILDDGWPEIFLAGLGIAQHMPGLLPLILALSRSFATVVFSNLGDVVRGMTYPPPIRDGRLIAGNLTLEQITAVPPVRPGTRLAMAATFYNGTMGLSTLGCPRTLGREGAEIFQELFVRRLLKLAAPQEPTASPPALHGCSAVKP